MKEGNLLKFLKKLYYLRSFPETVIKCCPFGDPCA